MKKTDYYLAIKIPGKDPDSVLAAMIALREEYGEEYFKEVFKSVTADNVAEFSSLSELEAYGVSVYFAHPYLSWERLKRYTNVGKRQTTAHSFLTQTMK